LVRQFRQLVDPLSAQLFSIENGEARSPETLALLGAMGMLSGWPDLGLVGTHALIHWIEIKLESSLQHARTELGADQRSIHALLSWYGHSVSVVRNSFEFWAIIDAHAIPHGPVPPRHEQLLLPRPRRRPVTRAKAGVAG